VGNVDYGGEAVSTGTQVNVSTLVQESLVFSVGTTGACGSLSGNQVYLGGSATAVLSSSAAKSGTSLMCVNTNAGSGYVLSYISNSAFGAGGAFTNYTGTVHDFSDSAGGATFTTGTTGGSDYFGMSLKAATGATGDAAGGANVAGGVAPTSYGAGYGTPDIFAFAHQTATTIASETTGATANTLYTAVYEGQAGTTTPFGNYQVNMNYLATSTF
jgi:hypothetical protein